MKKIKDSGTEIFIGEDVLSHIDHYLSLLKFSSVVFVIDENSEQYTLPLLQESSTFVSHTSHLTIHASQFTSHASHLTSHDSQFTIHINGTERHKNIDTVVFLWKKFEDLNLDRNSIVINVGGGVVSDMAGFAAATYKRGIRFINIPTTLLSMVDASVGGKTGIDFDSLKNQVGVFARPLAVFICPLFLQTLSCNEILSGMAEVIKMYAIAGKGLLCAEPSEKDIIFAVKEKARIVSKDFYEKGLRKTLNFGHTFGHAFESLLLEKGTPITHGEAVLWGMVCELWLSVKLCGFPATEYGRFLQFARANYPLLSSLTLSTQNIPALINYMQSDKKNANGKIYPVLLKKYGHSAYNLAIDKDIIIDCLVEFFS